MVAASPSKLGHHPTRKHLREERQRRERLTPLPDTSSICLPSRSHVPRVSIEAVPNEASRPNPYKKVTAGASVCALVLAFALPAFESSSYNAPTAAAPQPLFTTTELPAGGLPDSFSEISALEIVDTSPTSFTFRPKALVNYPFKEKVMLTDPFGYRTAPVEQFHDAQDFAAAAGTPIQAIADGKVLEAGFADDGCGFGLKLKHDIERKTATSRYCHMQTDSHAFKVGDVVKMGDPVGRVGNTGMSFGPHLHLALVLGKDPIDPMPFLAKYNRIDRTEMNPGAS